MGTLLSKSSSEDSNVETFSLIWLDATVNTSEENIKSQAILRESINQLTTFDNDHECIKHIQNRSVNDRIILISSGGLGKLIVPQIHELRQIFSIYIYCINKEAHEQWARKFVKVNRKFSSYI
jgi:lipopolysaccharide biosynthesis glycosyltransferase